MSSVNRVILVGRLGKEPEIRYSEGGGAMTNVIIATSDKYKDKTTGEQKEVVEWHRVTFFGRLAEVVSEHVQKGALIYIEGRLRTRKWTDQAGIDKYSTDIVADRMQMLGARAVPVSDEDSGQAAPTQPRPAAKARTQPTSSQSDYSDDHIPF